MDTEKAAMAAGTGAQAAEEHYVKVLSDAKITGKTAEEQMQDLNEKMLAKNFTMSGKPFPTFLKPFLVDRKLRDRFIYLTKTIMDAAEKVGNLYFEEENIRSLFEVPKDDVDLVEIQPPYPRRLILGRLDAFLNGDTLTFLEFNTDSPSGMGWHDELIRMFAELPAIKEVNKHHKLSYDILLDSFLDMLLVKYRESGGKKENPVIAEVSNDQSTIRHDVDIIEQYFKSEHGCDCFFADPRWCEYKDQQLYLNGRAVDIVHRDAIQDFTKYIDEVQPFLEAYRDGNVVMVNPFCSRVGGLKCVLWLLSDEQTQHLFTEEEKKVIDETIPWTRMMRNRKSLYRGKEIDLYDFVSKNRELFVLKPNGGYGGFDVNIGRESTQADWDATIEASTTRNFVVQEFVPIPVDRFPDFSDGFAMKDKNVNINFFAFNGEFGGGFVRVSDSSIINIHQGGGLVPIFYVE